MIHWTLKTIPIKELKPHPKNPRTLSREQASHLQKSLDKFGLIDKPILNLDFQIIGGHQRIAILKKNKVKEVECWIPSQMLSAQDVDELCIRLNRVHGEWDWELLANEWETTDLLEWGFNIDQLFEDHCKENEDTATDKEDKHEKCPHCGQKMKV